MTHEDARFRNDIQNALRDAVSEVTDEDYSSYDDQADHLMRQVLKVLGKPEPEVAFLIPPTPYGATSQTEESTWPDGTTSRRVRVREGIFDPWGPWMLEADDNSPERLCQPQHIMVTGHETEQTEKTFWADGRVTHRYRSRHHMGMPWGEWQDKQGEH